METDEAKVNDTVDLAVDVNQYGIERFDQFRFISHVLAGLVGIPLNAFALFIICTNRRLNRKPRNVLGAGMMAASLLTFVQGIIELVSDVYHSVSWCKAIVHVVGIGYTSLLFFTLLALADRYVALAYPLKHRTWITVRRVVATLVASFVVIVIVLKMPILLSGSPIVCAVRPEYYQIVTVSNLLLFLLCVLAQIVVYVKVRQLVRRDRLLSVDSHTAVSFVNAAEPAVNVISPVHSCPESVATSNHSATNSGQQQPPQTTGQTQQPSATHGMRVHPNRMGQQHIKQMEVDATWNLLHGVLSLIVFMSPILVLRFSQWGCEKVHGIGDDQCKWLIGWSSIAREFGIYHLICNAVVYIWRNREFSSTVSDKCCY